jgi:hypothetical protein
MISSFLKTHPQCNPRQVGLAAPLRSAQSRVAEFNFGELPAVAARDTNLRVLAHASRFSARLAICMSLESRTDFDRIPFGALRY